MITFKGVPLAWIGRSMRISRVGFFDGDKGKWKTDADGKFETKDGNPIWITAAGVEQTVAGDTITRLNGEAMGHRQRAETAEAKVKEFTDAGVTDAKAAAEAIATVGKLKDKTLIDAGKVDEVRAEVAKSYETKLADATKRGDTYESKLHGVLVASAFGGSKFITEKLTIPSDIAQATFGNRFKIENDRVVAMKADGSGPLYSTQRAGEVATFDEAMEIIVNEYPNKNAVLKGANNSGSGNDGKGGVGPGGKRVMKRAEFDALPLNSPERAKIASEMSQGKATIED
jgi:hypothetical protein